MLSRELNWVFLMPRTIESVNPTINATPHSSHAIHIHAPDEADTFSEAVKPDWHRMAGCSSEKLRTSLQATGLVEAEPSELAASFHAFAPEISNAEWHLLTRRRIDALIRPTWLPKKITDKTLLELFMAHAGLQDLRLQTAGTLYKRQVEHTGKRLSVRVRLGIGSRLSMLPAATGITIHSYPMVACPLQERHRWHARGGQRFSISVPVTFDDAQAW